LIIILLKKQTYTHLLVLIVIFLSNIHIYASVPFYPFEVGRVFFIPGRRLGGFRVVAGREHGVMRKALDVCSKYNASLLSLHFTLSPKGEKVFTLIYDLTECSAPLNEIAEEIRKIESIKEVTLIEQQAEGFIADTTSPIIAAGGVRGVILRTPLWSILVNKIREKFGSGGEALLYYIGVDMGAEAAVEHKKRAEALGLKEPDKITRILGATIFTSIGWGSMQIEEFTLNPPYALITVYNNFECETASASKKPYSQLTRGVIAGYLSHLLGLEMVLNETECIAKGDPYCRFECKPRK
jgi:predicted hydrocarbon binding protein